MSERILITGAEGFIGSHLCEVAVRDNRSVRAMYLYNSFGNRGWLDTLPAEIVDNMEVMAADVRDPGAVRIALEGCGAVLNLAALIAIPYSYHAPDSYVDVNVRGALNVLQAARAMDGVKVVQVSTSEVYGSAQRVPIDEDHPLVGQSPYAATKIAADQLALSFWRSFSLAVAVVRPFNTYGPRQSTRAVIPTIATQLARGERRLKLGAVSPTRDFTFATDTARGMLAVLDSEAAIGQVSNLGTGFEIAVGDLVQLMAEIHGVDVEIDCEAERLRPALSEVDRLCADNSRVRALTGWAPQYAGREGLARGLEETMRWFTEPANLAHYPGTGYQL